MDQKITDLDVAISMTASDLIPIVDSNGNNKVLHGSQVKDYVADAVVSDIDDVKAMISDEYDNTATYAVGDYCIYNNTLYRCTTAISTAEDFTPAHWTETSIDAELNLIGNKIDTKTDNTLINLSASFNIQIGSINSLRCDLFGKIVIVTGYFMPTNAISNNTTLVTVNGIKTITITFTSVYGSSGNRTGRFKLQSSGNNSVVVTENNLDNNEYYSFTLIGAIA